MKGFSFEHYTIMIFSGKQPNYSVTLISAKSFRLALQWHQQALLGVGSGPGYCGLFSRFILCCPKGCVPLHTVTGECEALGVAETWSLYLENWWAPLACAGHSLLMVHTSRAS